MSLTIEPKSSLTEFERQYLLDRGEDPNDYLLDAEPAEEGPETIGGATVRDGILEGDTSDGTSVYRGEGNPDIQDGDDEDVPYSEWTVKELELEIRRRNAERDEDDQIDPASDRKADLIAALEADDAEGDA